MSWPNVLERRWFPLLLTLLWALAYLPNLGERTLRLEEGRRATPAREMLASNDWVRPTLYGDTYLSKPPFYFWIVAAIGMMLGEVTPLATRLPSVLSSLGCALIAWRFAPNVLNVRTRAMASLFVLSASTLLDKGTLGEIDATLCMFVGLALKIWWDGARPEGQTFSSWIWIGALMGVSALLKGPAGPSLFYLTIVPYLFWTRSWRRLFTLGHFVCIVIAAAPTAAWVGALLHREVKSFSELIELWGIQLGAKHTVNTIANPESQWKHIREHYTEFPIQVLGMLVPGVLWLGFGFRRRWAESHGLDESLRRFLVCGAFVPFIAYYLYPQSRPRHLMAAFIPAEILAAYVVWGMSNLPGRYLNRSLRIASVLAFVPGLLGVAGLILAAIVHADGLPWAIAGFVIGTAWTWMLWRWTRSTSINDGVFAFGANAACGALAVWFIVNAVVIPWRIPDNPSFEARELSKRVNPNEPVYTTLTFPVKGEGYYNHQFHLSKDMRSAETLDLVKAYAPCQALMSPLEHIALEKDGWIVEEIGRMGGGKLGPAEVHVVRVIGPKK